MGWIPGWDSIEGAGWWSGFYFWMSISSLIGLGVFEVASHRYTDRHDELVEQQRTSEKEEHDAEIARLHLETAQANEKTEELKQRNLELEKAIAPRNLPANQQRRIANSLREFSGVQFLTQAYSTDAEGRRLEDQIIKMLTSAGFRFLQRGGNPPPEPLVTGVRILSNEAGVQLAETLCATLNASGIECNTDGPRVAGEPKTLTIWIGVKAVSQP